MHGFVAATVLAKRLKGADRQTEAICPVRAESAAPNFSCNEATDVWDTQAEARRTRRTGSLATIDAKW